MPKRLQGMQSWFVSPGGQVYTSPTIPFSGTPTTITVTTVPATPVLGNHQYAGLPVPQEASSVGAPSNVPAGARNQGMSIATSQTMRRYDPTTNRWNKVTRSPIPGFMLQVTPVQVNSGAILWFTGMASTGQMTLYRFVV